MRLLKGGVLGLKPSISYSSRNLSMHLSDIMPCARCLLIIRRISAKVANWSIRAAIAATSMTEFGGTVRKVREPWPKLLALISISKTEIQISLLYLGSLLMMASVEENIVKLFLTRCLAMLAGVLASVRRKLWPFLICWRIISMRLRPRAIVMVIKRTNKIKKILEMKLHRWRPPREDLRKCLVSLCLCVSKRWIFHQSKLSKLQAHFSSLTITRWWKLL